MRNVPAKRLPAGQDTGAQMYSPAARRVPGSGHPGPLDSG